MRTSKDFFVHKRGDAVLQKNTPDDRLKPQNMTMEELAKQGAAQAFQQADDEFSTDFKNDTTAGSDKNSL